MADQEWHYAVGNEQRGPVPPDQMRSLMAAGTIGPDTLVWAPSLTEWKPLSQTELAAPRAMAPATPAMPQMPGLQPTYAGPAYQTGPAAGLAAPASPGFVDAIKICFAKFITFSGRATRPEFWWFYLFYVIVYIVAGVLDASIGTRFLAGLAGLVFFLPMLSATARRLHDTDRSGWWMLMPIGVSLLVTIVSFALGGALFLGAAGMSSGSDSSALVGAGIGSMLIFLVLSLVSLAAAIWFLVFLCSRGTPGPNRFG